MGSANRGVILSFKRECRILQPPCWICGEEIDYTLKGGYWYFNADHYIPRFLGGTDSKDNLRPTHMLCNLRRGHRLPEHTIWVGPKEIGRWYDETPSQWLRRMNTEQGRNKRGRRIIARRKKKEVMVGSYPINGPITGPGIKPWPRRVDPNDERLLPPPEYRNQTRRMEESDGSTHQQG
ncbi:HNH endonuclease [Gordonia phage ASerpRocky]|uniref:HNH endonuclease n=1 Tax=Gordonia phage ASerpRocky TaxID=2599841 RepID=A0A5J6TDT8_9CAUD|nr:HNH endonuclease [Gordonia phage ASerpRocky]